MRTHGTLIKWNDDRGFGFVALPQSHEEVFVHISAFPRDGVRPRVGETVSFEVRTGPDGRKRAEQIVRPARRMATPRQEAPTRANRSNLVGRLFTGVAVAAIGFVGYDWYAARHEADTSPLPVAEAIDESFSCDGRTHCSQMTSCAEAEFFLKHCPGVQMDGNGDGEPCEQQWCN